MCYVRPQVQSCASTSRTSRTKFEENGDMKMRSGVRSRAINVARLAGSARCVAIWYTYTTCATLAAPGADSCCKQSAMLHKLGNPSTGNCPHASDALIPFKRSFGVPIVQRSPRVRIAPRFYDVQIAEQHCSHDASAWASDPRPFSTIRVVSAVVWDSAASVLENGRHFGPHTFWLVRAMRANLRVVEVESQIDASHQRLD